MRPERHSPPYDLARQPQRPGELGREVVLKLGRDSCREIERRAAAAGVPATLWATLAVEAARSVTLVETTLGVTAVEALSAAAVEARPRGRRSRLTDYADALRAATPRDPVAMIATMAVRPGLASATAWEAEAEAAEVALDVWLVLAIDRAPAKFVAWEAAAADEGRSLPEWALVHAARRCRSARTSAQIAG
jgi:hypothetical protein